MKKNTWNSIVKPNNAFFNKTSFIPFFKVIGVRVCSIGSSYKVFFHGSLYETFSSDTQLARYFKWVQAYGKIDSK